MSEPSRSATAAWTRLVTAQKQVVAGVEADLKAAGFPKLEWYDVLLALERAPDRRLRASELQARLLLPQYGLSRLVARMAEAGVVRVSPSPDDQRGRVVDLTPKGLELRAEMWPAYARAIRARVEDKLSTEEAAQLAGLLKKLTGGGSAV